ncbi:MAG: serpin family protein [Candidatus Binataceae bacterium]
MLEKIPLGLGGKSNYCDGRRVETKGTKEMTKPKVVFLALLWAMLGCAAVTLADAPQPTAAPNPKVCAAINDFGFRLLRALTNGSGENVIISPLSVSLALAMAYNGTAGETRTAMAKTLAVPPLSDDDFNRANHALLGTLRKADPAVQMEIANALWVQWGFPINSDFLKLSQDSYDASAQSLDFARNPREAADTINTWVDKNTGGKIPTIVARTDPNTRLVITDAVYFKGRWASPFNKKATETRTFHLQDGRSVTTPMMMQNGQYSYLENDSFQAIRLPYGNGRFVMYVFLPHTTSRLADFVRSLDETHWTEWTAKLSVRKGKIILPKLESTYGKTLNDALKAIGMAQAFDADKADFSRIHPIPPQLFINDVEHKTYIKVDEEGTEAAAATSVGIAATMALANRPPPFEMIVDHPFFCAVAEQHSGALLFAGVVADPTRK